MYSPFFGKPFKVIVLAMAVALIFILQLNISLAQDVTVNKTALADLANGGAKLFEQVNKGVIQVTMPADYGGIRGFGSGYVFDKEGYAITNRHVTDHKPVFEIAFWGDQEKSRELGYRYKAVLIAEDPGLDLGVIQVEAPTEKFTPVKLGDSALMKVGDIVATCGTPGGGASGGNYVDPSDPISGFLEFFNLNIGVLKEILPFENAFMIASGDFDLFTREHYGHALQYVFHVDAAINSGNSGGPCFNAYGEAVGTNTWRFWSGENWGASVPSNLLKNAIGDIIAYGHVRRPWVGIALHNEYDYSKYNELRMQGTFTSPHLWFDPRPDELKIYTINPYSPAYNAGLREGDIIELIDGKRMDYIFDIYAYFLNAKLGQRIEFKVRRGQGRPESFTVTVGERQVRYYGADITGEEFYGTNVGIRTFHSPLTY